MKIKKIINKNYSNSASPTIASNNTHNTKTTFETSQQIQTPPNKSKLLQEIIPS